MLEEFSGVGSPTPARASNTRRRGENLFEALDPIHEDVGAITNGTELSYEAFTALRIEPLETSLEQAEDLRHRVFERVDGALEGQKLSLNLLEREPLLHQALDGVDSSHRLDRIQTTRAEVLSFSANSARPWNEPELDVASEVRLAELHPSRVKGRHQVLRRDPIHMLGFECGEFVFGERISHWEA